MTARRTEFDAWLSGRFGDGGSFTVLVVLVRIAGTTVDLLRSTHLHVVGDEISWAELARMFAGAGVAWNAVACFEASDDPTEGLVPDATARVRLSVLVDRLHADRLVLNEGHFFDREGRRLRIDEVTAH